jgi:hypothetical protein
MEDRAQWRSQEDCAALDARGAQYQRYGGVLLDRARRAFREAATAPAGSDLCRTSHALPDPATAATTALPATRSGTAAGPPMHALSSCTAWFGIAAAVFTASMGARESRLATAPVHLDAVATILDAFRHHRVVALSEDHDEERAHAFRMSLIRDARFADVADDILVEFGNSLYQDVIDRFISGAPVADDALKRVWQDTTQPDTIWDRPIYEDFFRSVRAVNAALPRSRRLRVLLGDPPIDWENIHTLEDLQRASAGRSSHPADILMREVVANGRRALVLYGAVHLWRQNLQGPALIEQFEARSGERAFVIVTHPFANLDAVGVDSARWPERSIALTNGSSLENQLDAILYLGEPSGKRISRLGASLCSDRRYRAMRIRRMTLAGNEHAADQLERECHVER